MKRIQRVCRVLGSTVAICGATAATAQEAMSLGEVVVTASGHEQQIEDAPASISVIDQEKIEKRYYRNVTDALQDVPGVIVHGRYDVVTPLSTAWALSKAWPRAELNIIPDAGHSSMEPGIVDRLIQATDDFAVKYASLIGR